MPKFDWQKELEELGPEFPELMSKVEAQALINPDGTAEIVTGDQTFRVKLPESCRPILHLFWQGAKTETERCQLSGLLRILKSRRKVTDADGMDVRSEFMKAVRKREAQLASQLRQKLQTAE